MFKNMTRRSLAIGAAVSLSLTGLAALPAQAAGEVVLAPSAGTSYATFVTEDFTVQASLAAGQPIANIAQLKYKIEKANTFAVNYATDSTTSAVAATGSQIASATTSFVVAAVDPSSSEANKLSLAVAGATSASATVNVTVTAFLDSNSNGALDSGEFATAQTVSFKKYADVASVVTLTQPSEGDTAVSATATFTGLNADQLSADDTKVVFSVGGTASASGVVADADGVFADVFGAITTSATVSAQAVYKSENVGSAVTKTATNRTIASITSSAVVSNNAVNASAGAVTARLNTEYSFKAVVKDNATTPAGVAGAAVTVKVASGIALTSTQSITVAGTTYTDSAKLPTALAVGTTDATGAVVFAVKTTGFADGNTVTLTVSSQNFTADAVVVTNEVAAYAVANDADLLKTTLGAGFSVGYTVEDQFGVAMSRADRVEVTYNGTTKYATLSAGKASVAFTTPTTSGSVTVSATVQKQDTATLNWATAADVTSDADVSVLATNTADAFDTNPTATVSASISRVVSSALTNEVTLTGSVNNAGAKVTVAAAGVEFSTDGGDTTSVGSIVLSTDASGNFTVDAYAHVAGTQTVTYTVGSASKTTALVVDAAAAGEGKTLSITTNAVGGYVAPGSTVRATVSLADEYGNPVAAGASQLFGVTVTGPGFVGALPTTTGTDGNSAVFSILLGSADAGDLVITATYDADGATTTIKAITSVATVVVGSAPVADKKLTVGTFNGYIAIYAKGYEGKKLSAKVAGKWLTVEELTSFQRVVRKTGAGYSIKVDLYIDGVLAQSSTTVTK